MRDVLAVGSTHRLASVSILYECQLANHHTAHTSWHCSHVKEWYKISLIRKEISFWKYSVQFWAKQPVFVEFYDSFTVSARLRVINITRRHVLIVCDKWQSIKFTATLSTRLRPTVWKTSGRMNLFYVNDSRYFSQRHIGIWNCLPIIQSNWIVVQAVYGRMSTSVNMASQVRHAGCPCCRVNT